MSEITWQASAGRSLTGTIAVPGDKSVSHRAIMLGAIAEGASEISGFLEGEDTLATARAFAQMGVRIEQDQKGLRRVHGVGLHGLVPAGGDLDCGNAGTAMRLMTGLLAGQKFSSTLVGDPSLSRRPMERVIEPLTRMGAQIQSNSGCAPLLIEPVSALSAIYYQCPVASAQLKSAVLFAALYAQGTTTVNELRPTRDYSERMLRVFGCPIEFRPGFAQVEGGHKLRPAQIQVPGDFSSAAFLIVAACLVPGSDLLIRSVGINARRVGLIEVLRAMGADISKVDIRSEGGEPVCDFRVRAAPLRGIDVPEELVPDMIDEFPVLFVAAACAQGTTRIRGAHELRVKESDRIATMSAALRTLGISVQESDDGAEIVGGRLGGGTVDAAGDHRVAMSMVVAAQLAADPVRILDCANVNTSFPGFMALSQSVGFGLKVA